MCTFGVFALYATFFQKSRTTFTQREGQHPDLNDPCVASFPLKEIICLLKLLLNVYLTQNFEVKQLRKGGTWTDSVNTKEVNWYPLQKVNFARRKLEGANPAAITSYDKTTL